MHRNHKYECPMRSKRSQSVVGFKKPIPRLSFATKINCEITRAQYSMLLLLPPLKKYTREKGGKGMAPLIRPLESSLKQKMKISSSRANSKRKNYVNENSKQQKQYTFLRTHLHWHKGKRETSKSRWGIERPQKITGVLRVATASIFSILGQTEGNSAQVFSNFQDCSHMTTSATVARTRSAKDSPWADSHCILFIEKILPRQFMHWKGQKKSQGSPIFMQHST